MLSPAQPTNNPSELRIKLLRLLSYSAEGRRAARKRSRKSHSLGGSLEISTFSYSSEIFFRFADRAFSNRISRLFSHDATTSKPIAAIFLHMAYLCGGIGIASQFSIC